MSEDTEMECRKVLLSFYSSQISTHGSLIIGFSVILFTLVQIRISPQIQSAIQTIPLYLGFVLASFAIFYLFFRYISYGTLADYATRTPWKEPSVDETIMCKVEFFETEVSKNVRRKAQLKRLIQYFIGSTYGGFLITLFFALLTTFLLSLVLDYSWYVRFFSCLMR